MNKLTLAAVALLLVPLPAMAQLKIDQSTLPKSVQKKSIYNSIVRIEVATQVPDYKTPWNAGSFSGGTGTGFLIGENRFMTNAHVVSNQRRVLITMHGSAKKHKAKVLYVAHDCDLAILEVEDFSPFKGLETLKFDGVPKLESNVRVIGYPMGGDRISVTRGVVSRIDFRPYAHSQVDSHLVVQIDAAINPGNSGGPVLQDGKVVGVAFQGLTQADNTGYMIPTPIVKRFLKDIEDGSYDEYVDLGAATFPLFNPAMREALQLGADDEGVLVTNVTAAGSADGVLEKGDIIQKIDGIAVDSSGNVLLHGERVNMNEIVERKFVGDKVTLNVQRDGLALKLTVTLKKFPQARMHAVKYGVRPRYTIKGGLVFQPLDRNLYGAHRLSNPRVRKLFAEYISEGIFKERKDIVILTRVMKDPINSSISGSKGLAVAKINGVKIKDLNHAHQLLNPETIPEHFVIECDGVNRPFIILGKNIKEADLRVQRQYGIKKLFNLEEKIK